MLIFLSLTLLLLDSRGYLEKNIRYYLQSTVAPLQFIVNFPTMMFDKMLTAFMSQERLIKENQALKAELILLKLHQQRFFDLENENRQLRALLHTSEKRQIKVKVAEVLFVAASDHSDEWILNVGKREGAYVGQAVLDARGIVGQIVMVGPTTSRVMLISDSQSSIPVESLKTGLRSMLQGDGINHPLDLVFIPQTENVLVGDLLVSSGEGGHFPKGYPVGRISKVVARAGDQFLAINVKPIAQLTHERFVLLIEEENA